MSVSGTYSRSLDDVLRACYIAATSVTWDQSTVAASIRQEAPSDLLVEAAAQALRKSLRYASSAAEAWSDAAEGGGSVAMDRGRALGERSIGWNRTGILLLSFVDYAREDGR